MVYSSEEYLIRKDAYAEFERNVRNYSILVKAESKPLNDIQVYAEKIEYRKIDPDCCMNCKFCKIDRIMRFGRDKCLVCTNPENFIMFKNLDCGDCCPHGIRDEWIGFDPSWIPSEIGNVGYSFGDGRRHTRPRRDHNGDYVSLDVRPKVDFNGICKNYARRKM